MAWLLTIGKGKNLLECFVQIARSRGQEVEMAVSVKRMSDISISTNCIVETMEWRGL